MDKPSRVRIAQECSGRVEERVIARSIKLSSVKDAGIWFLQIRRYRRVCAHNLTTASRYAPDSIFQNTKAQAAYFVFFALSPKPTRLIQLP